MPIDSPIAHTDAAVECRGLTKLYHDKERGEIRALDGLDLDCRYGEIYGLLGPNGAGKSTCLRILASMLTPTSGSARLAGIDVATDPLEVRRRIGYLSATTGLYPRLDVRETLAYFGALHGLTGRVLEQRIEELVEAFDMGSYATRRTEHMSSGQKQRLSIARAVIHDPEVLILDEPTTGLDILATSDMIEFIAARKAGQRCVLFSTHVLSEAERLCDRIGILFAGKLLGVGTLAELSARTGEGFLDGIFRALVREAKARPAH